MLTSSASGEQLSLYSFAPKPPDAFIIRGVRSIVRDILDRDEELRSKVLSFDKGALWSLTLRVGAVRGKKVNPETVARTVRKYKNGR